MMTSYDLTSYKFYSNREDMELISVIVDALKILNKEDILIVQHRFEWNHFDRMKVHEQCEQARA